MHFLWSICIPTYNRAKYLNRNLTAIFHQMHDDLYDQIEILVSDNASTDETEQVIKSFLLMGKNITYYRNNSNVGSDANFLSCVEKAQGKYVLLLGDDDILLDGSLDTILSVLREDDYGLVYLSGVAFKEKIPRNKAPQYIDLDRKIIEDANVFLRQVSFYITFMTGNIFNKSHLNSNIDYTAFIGSNFVQVPLFITSALYAKKNVFLTQNFFAAQTENSGGYGAFETFGIRFNEVLDKMMLYGLQRRTIQSINNAMLRRQFSMFIFQHTADDDYDNEDINVLKNIYGTNWRYWVFDYVLYCLPKSLKQGYFFIIRFVNKILKMARGRL